MVTLWLLASDRADARTYRWELERAGSRAESLLDGGAELAQLGLTELLERVFARGWQ